MPRREFFRLDSTAEDEHSDHNRTIFDPRQAPEGNRGRDDWMTAIEVQAYMGASIFTESHLSPDGKMNTMYSI